MNKESPFARLRDEVLAIKRGSGNDSGVLEKVASLLRREVDHYDWVGFYRALPAEEELVLGPYDGAPTEHDRIDYGNGVCGQAAETKETFTVQNVEEEDNYLSCSPEVKSEIVVPVFEEGILVGEIDIDSHSVSPFGPDDEAFLEDLARELAPLF